MSKAEKKAPEPFKARADSKDDPDKLQEDNIARDTIRVRVLNVAQYQADVRRE